MFEWQGESADKRTTQRKLKVKEANIIFAAMDN
jgi:hypothetical protein